MNATVNVERLLLRVQCLCECPEVLRSSQFHCQFLFVWKSNFRFDSIIFSSSTLHQTFLIAPAIIPSAQCLSAQRFALVFLLTIVFDVQTRSKYAASFSDCRIFTFLTIRVLTDSQRNGRSWFAITASIRLSCTWRIRMTSWWETTICTKRSSVRPSWAPLS